MLISQNIACAYYRDKSTNKAVLFIKNSLSTILKITISCKRKCGALVFAANQFMLCELLPRRQPI